jgi:hypothetical protein
MTTFKTIEMKKLKIYQYAFIIAIAVVAFACKKTDTATIDDNFLNYKITDVPVTQDYITGAFYVNYGTFNTTATEVPVAGKYSFTNGLPPAGVLAQHIAQAKTAKLDYFIFSVRSANLDFNNYKTDSVLVNAFLAEPGAGGMKFALSYNLSTASLGNISATAPIETKTTQLESFYRDFQRMSVYFKSANYMKVNGKYLVIMNRAQDLAANSNPAIYAEIRKRLSAMGYELYIVGMQGQWTPPQRFYYRFQNCVDAMYEADMINTGANLERSYLFPQYCDQNWAYWKEYLASINIEFVPCVQPAYNINIGTPSSLNYNFTRADSGAFYQTYCNVAKRNISKSRLVIIDNFNDWNHDEQIEASKSYGNKYLDITRQAFKLP